MDHYNDPSVAAYFDSIRGIALLSADDETRLSRATRRGDMKARAAMIEANLLLVADIARKYVGQGLDYLDLIMAGNEALIKRVDSFDASLGIRFSSYAYDNISGAIYRATQETGKMIRLPVYVADADNRARRDGDGRLVVMVQPVSLDAKIGDECDGQTLGDTVADESPAPDEQVVKQELYKQVERAFMTLNARDRKLLRLRLGFNDDGTIYTLRQVGALLGISRQTVLNRENIAIAKLQAILGVNKTVSIRKARRGLVLRAS